jgi:hypothetical protein
MIGSVILDTILCILPATDAAIIFILLVSLTAELSKTSAKAETSNVFPSKF